MSDDEFLSDDDYVPVPLKEVARHELLPIGTAARIAELEEWQRKRTKITGQVIDETAVLEARIKQLEAELDAVRIGLRILAAGGAAGKSD